MKSKAEIVATKFRIKLPTFRQFFSRWKAWGTGSFMGAIVGAVPGVGADGATWLAYGTVKNNSKNAAISNSYVQVTNASMKKL